MNKSAQAPMAQRGRGRPKGVPNKTTTLFKEAVEAAFTDLDGVNGLVKWARENQDAFYTQVFPKLAPLQIYASTQHTERVIHTIELVPVEPVEQMDAGLVEIDVSRTIAN